MPVEPRRLDQAHDRRRPFAAAQRTCKEPVFATQRPRSDLVLAPIIVNGYGPVIGALAKDVGRSGDMIAS